MSRRPVVGGSGRHAVLLRLVGLLALVATALSQRNQNRALVRQSYRRHAACFAPAQMAIQRQAGVDGPKSYLPTAACKSPPPSSLSLSLWKRNKSHVEVQGNGEEASKRVLLVSLVQRMVSRIATLRRKDRKVKSAVPANESSVRLRMSRKWRPAAFALLSASTVVRSTVGGGMPSGGLAALVQPAHAAAANLPLVPKLQTPKPHLEAIQMAKDRKARYKAADLLEFNRERERIEREEGKEAADAYVEAYNREEKKKADLKERKVERMKVEMMREGLDPCNDPEFERRMTLFETGVDLNDFFTTRQGVEFQQMKTLSQPRAARRQQTIDGRRYIVRCTVFQLEKQGVNPMEFFEENKVTMAKLYTYNDAEIDRRVETYKSQMMEAGGQVEPIFEPLPPLEGTEEALTPAEQKARDKKAKEDAKQKAKAEAARLKMEEKAKKEEQKKEAARLKAEEKAREKEKSAAATAAAAGATVAGAAAAAGAAATSAAEGVAGSVADAIPNAIPAPTERVVGSSKESVASTPSGDAGADTEISADDTASATSVTPVVGSLAEKEGGLPIVPAATVLVALSAGGYVYQTNRRNAAIAEEERKRNLSRIMGSDKFEPKPTPTATVVDVKTESETPAIADTPDEPAAETDADDGDIESATKEAPTRKKRKKGGLASVFRKKSGNSRPTDLSTLVAEDAAAPGLAKTLAKILTFGAPGRFPDVVALPGEMPLEEFDLEKAKAILAAEREKANLEEKDAAELFASVVNCMIIDIIDLASSALKEKEDKIVVDALNVVMDFMDSAASLFDVVAKGVTITPVTYGGDLPKSKLEQMFGVYASSQLMGSQERIDMLQVVFSINDKKAQGIIQRNVLKSMMKMMKDGKAPEGMEGMEDLMAAMGGMEGAGGEGLDAMNPENLKESVQAMKELMDSGSVSKEEIDMVKDQFKEMYGSDLSELIAAADNEDAQAALGEDGKELLDMFKKMMKE